VLRVHPAQAADVTLSYIFLQPGYTQPQSAVLCRVAMTAACSKLYQLHPETSLRYALTAIAFAAPAVDFSLYRDSSVLMNISLWMS
jgi:hypothetical protein